MPRSCDSVVFSAVLRARDFYGSRLRCLLLTHQSDETVARLLTALVRPYATVDPGDTWMPRGFLEPEEARLGETPGFLCEDHRQVMTNWWLAVRGGANTPNWDIASNCWIEGRRGLMLVEAKAHHGELSNDHLNSRNEGNRNSICAAIPEANDGFSRMGVGWGLRTDSHYQLSNRFAWAWKIAMLGIPVVLVYLGFLGAEEMACRGCRPLRSKDEWAKLVRSQSAKIVPATAWDQKLTIDGTPMYVLVRSMELCWEVNGATNVPV